MRCLAASPPALTMIHMMAAEFRALHAKARQLVDAGAAGVTLMFDDIDEPPVTDTA